MADVDYGALLKTIGNISDAAVAAGNVANSLPWTRPAYRQFCRIAAGTGVPQALNSIDVPSICQPYLDDDGRTFGETEAPFTGGQCDGVSYNLNITSFAKRNGEVKLNATLNHTATGPFSYVSSDTDTFLLRQLKDKFGGVIQQANIGGNPGDSLEATLTVNSISRVDGGPDNCGNPPGVYVPGDGYEGEDYDEPFNYTDPSGRQWNINVGAPSVGIDGSIQIPVNVDGVELNLGGESDAPPSVPTPTGQPDFDNPLDPVRPGDDGQPTDGVNYSGPVACAIVVVTQEATNASQEIGGPEAIFLPGFDSDAGWYRFRKGTGTTQPKRLIGRSTIDCYCCAGDDFADGFQVKFSYGYDGYVVIIPPVTTE